ncbi:MAG TPA: acetyltransferase [Acidobacteriaceae bacterium]|nr:acetyltransferase [Acidobacteriaceae bacterium]
MQPFVVIGGGGHAAVVICLLRKLQYQLIGYTDLKNNGLILGVPYLGPDDHLHAIAASTPNLRAAIGIGQIAEGKKRCSIVEGLSLSLAYFPPIVSPSAIVNESVTLGEGAVVMDGAIINPGASIGRGAIINTHSTVEHDAIVGDWAHIAPGATLCGNVHVGKFAMVGAGATVIEGVSIGSSCMIAAGATVVHTISTAGVYAGTPARLLHARAGVL